VGINARTCTPGLFIRVTKPPFLGGFVTGNDNPQPFHGIQFAIPDEAYYETQDGLSWGVNPTYSHDWNQGGSEIKVQISRAKRQLYQPSGGRR